MHTALFSTDGRMEIAKVLSKQHQSRIGVVLTEHLGVTPVNDYIIDESWFLSIEMQHDGVQIKHV